MNLLDRHIFKSVLFTCLAAVGLFAFVVALANFVRDLLGPLLAGQLSLSMLVRLILLLFPYAVIYALPAGMLTGVLLTLGRLSADSEITAMRAAGIGILRAARPVWILGIFGTIAALYSNYESMPWSRVQYHRVFADAIRKNPLTFIVPKTFVRDFKGYVVYVGASQKSNDTTVLRDVWIWKLDHESRVASTAHADSGEIVYDPGEQSFIVTLNHAMTGERDDNAPESFYDHAPKEQGWQTLQQFRIPVSRYVGQDIFHVKPEWLRYGALQAQRARLAAEPPAPGKEKESHVAQMKLAMIVSEKGSLSLAVFAFAFVAVPLGIKVSRRETSANLGIAVLLVLTYYILLAAVKSLDAHPEYRPDLLMWVPNVLFLGFGGWLIGKVER